MKNFQIKHFVSGGLITNYYCTSRCAHCLYACSSSRKKEYITGEHSAEILQKAKLLDINRLHIGGGEPLLNPDGLLGVLNEFKKFGILPEYAETNSSWYKSEKNCINTLLILKKHGLNTLLISISPFHNEFVPFYKVKSLIKACRIAGMQVFPWIMDFFSEIDKMEDKKTHTLQEYCQIYGDDYMKTIPSRYWVTMRGRAISAYESYLPKYTIEQIFKSNDSCCHELSDTTHFHLDLYGNYIPGLCAGLAININDLGAPLDPMKYPFLHLLATEGIHSLYHEAARNYAFIPKNNYISKCDLCQHIRQYLIIEKNIDSADLKPVSFYTQLI